MNRAAIVRSVLFVVVLTAESACSPLGRDFKTPDLQVVGIEMIRGDLFSQQLRVKLRVTNPNDRVIPVRSIQYQMEVGGAAFAQGESSNAFEVAALSSTDFDVNMTANAAGALMSLLQKSERSNDVQYRLHGRVQLASGILRSLPFEKKGAFNLK
jgi:LEA14-like dessication related protein